MEHLRFDDIPALRSQISEEFGPWSKEVEISQSLIDAFAEMTGDRQWIHIDAVRAAQESPYGSTIAHGFLLLGMATFIKNSADLVIVGHHNALNYGLDRVRFISPVPAGARIRGRSRISAVTEDTRGTMLTVSVMIEALGGERPAVTFDWKLLYRN